MTRVDFYVVEPGTDADADSAELVACRLAAKAFGQGHRVFIKVASDERAARLDTLLWTFRDTSFIPHGCAGSAAGADEQVLIGTAEPPDGHNDVMINLDAEVPPAFSRFERVVEIVPAAGPGRDAARSRYRFYQERGYRLETHPLNGRRRA